MEKFDTCKFRTKEKHPSPSTPLCCGRKVDNEGYQCLEPHLLLPSVVPSICEACIYYVAKNEDN